MKNRPSSIIGVLLFVGIVLTGAVNADTTPSQGSVSGKIVGGFRVLAIPQTEDPITLTVYRGDYIKFQFDPALGEPTLTIPALAVKQALLQALDKTAYFKMKEIGQLAFTLGQTQGLLNVIEYQQANYQEVTSAEAKNLIEQLQPLILDVRTPREFKGGHLANARLIPVQTLQTRWKEIAQYQDKNVLIYCATGNRSTVASKILIDNGFKRIYNMRRGIADWHGQKYPIVR